MLSEWFYQNLAGRNAHRRCHCDDCAEAGHEIRSNLCCPRRGTLTTLPGVGAFRYSSNALVNVSSSLGGISRDAHTVSEQLAHANAISVSEQIRHFGSGTPVIQAICPAYSVIARTYSRASSHLAFSQIRLLPGTPANTVSAIPATAHWSGAARRVRFLTSTRVSAASSPPRQTAIHIPYGLHPRKQTI